VWPQWVPLVGGSYFEFFSPVFNIADSSIFIGVVIILIMQRKFFKHAEETDSVQAPDQAESRTEIPVESSASQGSDTRFE
jgi:signal peptidase II